MINDPDEFYRLMDLAKKLGIDTTGFERAREIMLLLQRIAPRPCASDGKITPAEKHGDEAGPRD